MRKLLMKTAGTFIFLITVLLFMVTNYAYAEVAGSSGDIKPLNFISCTLEDGSRINGAEIANLKPKFTLLFDKNVVNMLVWENNRKCVSILSDNNSSVPVDVSKIDDTVDFDHRQQIFVQPVNQLEPGRTYYIKVSPDLVAKNGVATLGETTGGQGVTISFKTKTSEVVQTAAPAEGNNSPKAASDQQDEVKTSDNSKKISEATASVDADKANIWDGSDKSEIAKSSEVTASEQPEIKENASKDNLQEDGTSGTDSELLMGNVDYNRYISISIAVIIVLWIVIEFFIKRNKKQGSKKLKL
ncbi:MAG: hypothetical protein ABRQ25_10900 [Clostridiaceae bacterium]